MRDKIGYRIISFFLVFVNIFCCFKYAVVAEGYDENSSGESESIIGEEEIVGGEYQIGEWVRITYDGQVVDTITVNGISVDAKYVTLATRNKINVGEDTTYSCAAFIKRFYSSVYGVSVYNLLGPSYVPQTTNGVGFTQVSKPQIGDIVRDNEATHWAIVKSVQSDGTVVLIQQNHNRGNINDGYAYGMKNGAVGSRSVAYFRYNGNINTKIITLGCNDELNKEYYSGTCHFSARRNDNDSNHHLQWFMDDVAITGFQSADKDGWFSIDIDTTKYSNGNHKLSVEYCNTLSSWTDSATINIKNENKHYKLYIDPNGGTLPDGSTKKITAPVDLIQNEGNWWTVKEYTPTRSGYIFEGWYDAPTGGIRVYNSDGNNVGDGKYWYVNYIGNQDLTIYAHWKKGIEICDYKDGDIFSGKVKVYTKRNDSDANHYMHFYVDDKPIKEYMQADSNGYFLVELDTSKYADGEHKISVHYANSQAAYDDSRTIRIINKGIEICDYKDGDLFSGTMKIYMKRFENDPEHYLNFYVDDVCVKELMKADSNGYFLMNLDTSKYSDGEHKIKAYYANSKYAYQDERTIRIINKGIEIINYKEGDTVSGNIIIKAKRFESDPGHYLNLYVDNVLVKELIKADVNDNFDIELDTSKYEDGQHTIRVYYANTLYAYSDEKKIVFNNKKAKVEGVKGDLTGDGEVTMGDVVKIARVVGGYITLTPEEEALADVTGDGNVAMGDVVKIARYVGGYIDSL